MEVTRTVGTVAGVARRGSVWKRAACWVGTAVLLAFGSTVFAADADQTSAIANLREYLGEAGTLGVDGVNLFIYLAAGALIVTLGVGAVTNRISWGFAILGIVMIAVIVVMAGAYLDDATTAAGTLSGGGG